MKYGTTYMKYIYFEVLLLIFCWCCSEWWFTGCCCLFVVFLYHYLLFMIYLLLIGFSVTFVRHLLMKHIQQLNSLLYDTKRVVCPEGSRRAPRTRKGSHVLYNI